MGKLSEALGMGDMMGDEAPPSSADAMDKEDKPKGSSAEVLAMKQFSRATEPEAKVQALRDLLEAMGVC